MKSKIFIFTLVATLYNANAQTASQSRIDGTTRDQTLPAASQNLSTQSSDSTDLAESDTGAQRPIALSKSAISAFFSYDSKFSYHDNPTYQKNALSNYKTSIWENTFRGGFALGAFDFDDAIVTPYIGGSYKILDYLEETLAQDGINNFNLSQAYALLHSQFSNGWSGRLGITYAMEKDTELDEEVYSDFVPTLGITKIYSLNQSTFAIFDAYIGLHKTTTDQTPTDLSDKLTVSASYGLVHNYDSFVIKPSYSLTHKSYDKGVDGLNDGRKDLTHNLGLKIDYPIAESLNIELSSAYMINDTSGYSLEGDYEAFIAGLGLTLNSRF